MAGTPQSPNPKPGDRAEGATRELAGRIARAKKDRVAVEAARAFRQREMTGFGRAFRFASEFVAAIIVGGAIGYVIDLAVGTKPWAMIVFLLLGFAAGVLNVMRAAAEMTADVARNAGTSSAPNDDDER